jgi:RNA recognition motif-containing protein
MNLHLSNIAPSVTQIELKAFLERVSSVGAVKMLPGGDALVVFESEADADRALAELDGAVLAGRTLSMRRALPRREREGEMRSGGAQDVGKQD